MVKLVIHQIQCFENFEAGKFKSRKKRAAKKKYIVIVVVVIAKNGTPKVFKKLLNRPDECCYKSRKDWRSMSRASKFHGVPKITLHDRISGNWFLLMQYIFSIQFSYWYYISFIFFIVFCHRIFYVFVILRKVGESFESYEKSRNVSKGQILEHFAKDSIPKSFSPQSFPFE